MELSTAIGNSLEKILLHIEMAPAGDPTEKDDLFAVA